MIITEAKKQLEGLIKPEKGYLAGQTDKTFVKDIEALDNFIKTFIAIQSAFVDFIDAALECYPNKRILHLSRYSKKRRIRKKNFRKIRKWIEKGE